MIKYDPVTHKVVPRHATDEQLAQAVHNINRKVTKDVVTIEMLRAYYAQLIYAAPAFVPSIVMQESDSWQRLALQFDGHRMQALWHLNALMQDPAKHSLVVTKFLAAAPLSGEEVLRQRIADLAVHAQERTTMIVGTEATQDGVYVSIYLKRGDEITSLYAEKHPLKSGTMGHVHLPYTLAGYFTPASAQRLCKLDAIHAAWGRLATNLNLTGKTDSEVSMLREMFACGWDANEKYAAPAQNLCPSCGEVKCDPEGCLGGAGLFCPPPASSVRPIPDGVNSLLSVPVLTKAAEAVEASATVWTGFAMLDAKTCIDAALDAAGYILVQPQSEAHDNLRDRIGQALNDEIESGAESPDWCDSREIDRLADAVMKVIAHPIPDTVFPARDLSKPAEQQGLFEKFQLRRTDGSSDPGGKHYGCRYFVLDMDHDAFAPAALRAYAAECATTHPELARDLTVMFGAQDVARTKLANMSHETIQGWYFDCDGHYIDVEKDDQGKYSILFRDRSNGTDSWLDQADTIDAKRFRWLTEDHDDPVVREKCREILSRMPVLTYSAASADIDAAMKGNHSLSNLTQKDPT